MNDQDIKPGVTFRSHFRGRICGLHYHLWNDYRILKVGDPQLGDLQPVTVQRIATDYGPTPDDPDEIHHWVRAAIIPKDVLLTAPPVAS